MKLVKLNDYTLDDCPVGLFLFDNTLCMKTEYGTSSGAIESFIVSSGEAFWGGTDTATEQRNLMVTAVQVDMSNRAPELVEGIPYIPYPIAFHTVDVIATTFIDNKKNFLLGRKHNSNDWVFIGGFVEPTHTTEHTAVKEFHEEAGVLINESRFVYMGSLFIDDKRYKDTCHKITTSIFTIDLYTDEVRKVKGGDDIAEVKFFQLDEVYDNLSPLHHKIFIKFLSNK